MAYNKPITVFELAQNCVELIKKWYADKYVFLIDDDEGNWCHACWYLISPEIDYEDYKDDCKRNGCDPKDCVLLW